MSLGELYSPKQQEVLKFAMNNDFFMLINHGAKRSGKTVVDNDLFLYELKRVRRIANQIGVALPQYILAGSDLGAVHRNILNELTNKYGLEFQFDKFNRFELFGVRVCCFGHSKVNDLGRIRGMTAFGAYINEATVANQEVFNEIKSRCSGDGARILIDTNPDNPLHWLKQDYINKADGKTIAGFHWKLSDNTFLSDRYKRSIIESTPSGMFTDRDINGAWVAASGIVYPDFKEEVHFITADKVPSMVRHFVGVDFGWEHYGVFALFGVGIDGNIYLLREWSAKHRSIDEWIKIGKSITEKYGDILFYCDSARPDRIRELQIGGLRAMNAIKDVIAGIGYCASLMKQKKLFVVVENVTRFKEEIGVYAWKENADEPVKEMDDGMDAMRYGVYSDKIYGGR